MPKEEEINVECSIACRDETISWYYLKDIRKGDDENYTINHDNFISFLSKTTNSGNVNDMKIYHVDNKDTPTEDGSEIEDAGDFGIYFDDIDDDDNEIVYFKMKQNVFK